MLDVSDVMRESYQDLATKRLDVRCQLGDVMRGSYQHLATSISRLATSIYQLPTSIDLSGRKYSFRVDMKRRVRFDTLCKSALCESDRVQLQLQLTARDLLFEDQQARDRFA